MKEWRAVERQHCRTYGFPQHNHDTARIHGVIYRRSDGERRSCEKWPRLDETIAHKDEKNERDEMPNHFKSLKHCFFGIILRKSGGVTGEDFTRLAAVCRTDDAVFLKHIHQSCRSRVAYL